MGSKKKAFAPKTAPLKTKGKKIIRVQSSKDYDSESDLSVASDNEDAVSTTPARRPSRAAAVSATKQLSKSKAEWVEKTTGTDSDDYSSDDEDSSDDDSPDQESVVRGRGTKQPMKKKAKQAESGSEGDSSSETERSESESESDSDSEEEEERMKRARQKQAEALALAKANKGKPAMKKNFPAKAKDGKKKTAAGKKKKKFDDDSSSDEEDDRDPMEGIDMDRLIEEAMEGSQMSVLHSVCWWRIILDEAHCIKSRSSGTANAAFSLIGIHRWCLTGTPLQNRVGELYSLIRFLRIDPMAHYFCRAKDCDCKSLHYRMMNGKCKGCGHGSVQHFSHFNKFVLNPIKSYGYTGDGRRAMFKLKEEVLDKSLLRRTKETKADDLNLPPRLVTISKVRLHPVEEDFYNALYTQTQSSFNDYVNEGTLLNNYAHIFDLLMRMRQAVDHPYLVVYSKKDTVRQDAARAGQAAVANGSVDCDLCHEPPTDRVLSSCCQAAFCRGCVVDYMSSLLHGSDDANTPCPSCQQPFSINLNQASTSIVDDETLVASRGSSDGMPSLKELPHVSTGSILRRINLAEYATSSKIEALTQELVNMRKTSPGSKAIVFSQFVSMIDLIRWRLHSDPCLANMGLGVRALHGSMDVKARDASLKEFREDGNVRVLLMSLKAGGVALNLTVANYIYLMDPWWNPAAEMQAIDRTHRLGQYRPIRAVRFIAENTVEERILQLQEKKRLVFDGTVGRDAGSLKMLTVDDMKSLFA
jgi:DNA repair protein RAD16